MGSDYFQSQIPVINLSNTSLKLDRGSENWNNLCKRVREACENNGCFEIVYNKIPVQLRDETFSHIRQLFGLPLETKKKNFNPKPYHGYYGQFPEAPLYDSFGIEDASNYESLKGFSALMWPNGHYKFMNTFFSIMKQLDDLYHMIEVMILDSYEMGEKLDSIMECRTLVRLMQYKAPPVGETMKGLSPHTDKLLSTILFDDQISGLEVETKDGQWVQLSISPTSFVFVVGDPLMAWSNGKMHSVKHRVIMSGKEERYSMGAFAVPIEGSIVKPAKEFVDEQHPQILKDFDFMDFLRWSSTLEGRANDSDKQIFVFTENLT